jgi:ssDNA-binding Zn-finger/Zn-ribbon topoisomerase 1
VDQDIQYECIKKRKTAGHINFAVVAGTGELVSVESVKSGLACDCVCAACGRPMEARKGDIRRHHFAHASNYDCLYGPEISVYMAFYSVLMKERKLLLPDAVLKFSSYKKHEIVKPSFLLELSDISYHCADGQYPPTLVCSADANKLQVILDFGGYYNADDLNRLKQTAKNNGFALLLINIPDVDDLSSMDELHQYAVASPKSKEWVYNRRIEESDRRYRDNAVHPAEFYGGYLCEAQKGVYKNVYSVRREDCVECEYCYDIDSGCLCLAHNHINHFNDFKKTPAERKMSFESANSIKPIKKIHEHKCPECGASLRRVNGKNGVFAGCSNYPECKRTFGVEPTTEQLIIR